jgi:hypothetical protein
LYSYLKSKLSFLLPYLIKILSLLLAYWIYDNQDLISDYNLHAFLMAICAVAAIVSISGLWNSLTDGTTLLAFYKVKITNHQLVYFLLSFFFAYEVFEYYSPYMFDDSAFTLRYLDNFKEGYFYHYNKTDPPVFGISCFTFGVFTGFWCWLHVLSPEHSIHLAGFAGLVMVSFLVFKILRELVSDNRLILIFWLAVIFSSKMFLNVAKSGMESAFHISILFAALLFFLQNKHKWMWFFLALSIISKLDAVPLVFVTGLTFLLINRKKILPLSYKNSFIKDFLIFAVLPIFCWVIFATLVFGSPLPQSAYSKIYLHFHPDDYWFPFIKYYFFGGRVALIFQVFMGLFILHLLVVCAQYKKFSFKNLVFGFSFMATMVLFYFYNPGEQMTWYYVLPDLLLLLQIAVSFWFFISLIPQVVVRTVIVSLALFFFVGWAGIDVIGGKFWMETYLEKVERERLEIGKYVGTQVGVNDSIMSNHGLPVRHVKGYVIDMSGLNSKFAASVNVDAEELFKNHHPKWAISHNSSGYAAFLSANNYAPVRIFYDITNYAFPEWCLYKKKSPKEEMCSFKLIDSAKVKGTKPSYNGGIVLYNDDTLTIDIDSANFVKQVFFGIARHSLPFSIEIKKLNSNNLVSTERIQIDPIGEYPMDSKFSKSVILSCSPEMPFNRLVINSDTAGLHFTLIEPYIYKKKI